MSKIQGIRGTRDILPAEVGYWQHVETIARGYLQRAVYREIRTPAFEYTELFERGIGEATDVVGKEMYTFLDKGDRSLTLRPEGTAGAVRAAIERGLTALGGVQRLWYTGPMFRYERPGAGRQRQFHQLGVEVLGSSSPRADAEVIALAMEILAAVGVEDLTLHLNSLGSGDDRLRYRTALVEYLTPYRDSLDPDSQDRLTRNPLRILDSKDARTQEIVADAPKIIDYLGDRAKGHFDTVKSILTDLGISFIIDPQLVRGLDYYTDTAFEIQTTGLGDRLTVCGGGRYDGLISSLGGGDVPSVGWAIGLERLVLLLQDRMPAPDIGIDIYAISRGELAEKLIIKAARELRGSGATVEVDLSGAAFKKQFARADKSGAKICIICGDAEAENGTVKWKNMVTSEEEIVAIDELKSKVGVH
jgi:histidyl-tRNA synthetase